MDRHELEELSEDYAEDSRQGNSRPKPQRASSKRFSKQKRKGPLGMRGRSNFRSVSSSEKRTRQNGTS